MNINDLVQFKNRLATNDDFTEEDNEFVNRVGDYMNRMSEEGKKIVLYKLTEAQFVKAINILESTLIGNMTTYNKGFAIMIARQSGELEPFLHTMILSVIGALADEEVI